MSTDKTIYRYPADEVTLWSMRDAARAFGRTHKAVQQWRQRKEGPFPEPDETTTSGPLWRPETCLAWARKWRPELLGPAED